MDKSFHYLSCGHLICTGIFFRGIV